jgi:hypothetical protein
MTACSPALERQVLALRAWFRSRPVRGGCSCCCCMYCGQPAMLACHCMFCVPYIYGTMPVHPTGHSGQRSCHADRLTDLCCGPSALQSVSLGRCRQWCPQHRGVRQPRTEDAFVVKFSSGSLRKSNGPPCYLQVISATPLHTAFLLSMPCFRPFHGGWSRPFLGASGAEVWEGVEQLIHWHCRGNQPGKGRSPSLLPSNSIGCKWYVFRRLGCLHAMSMDNDLYSSLPRHRHVSGA